MAFFTRVNLNVPVLPPEDSLCENPSSPSPSAIQHRRHASEPVTTEYMVSKLGAQGVSNLTTRSNSVPSGNTSAMRTDGAATNNTTAVTNVAEDVPANSTNKSVNAKGRPAEANAHCQENGQGENLKSTEENDGEEPRRYEYVVDRVLGVEV